MILQLNLTNSATNGLNYYYTGYVEFWLVKYSSITDPSDPGEYSFKKLLGEAPLNTNGTVGLASLEISNDVIESVSDGSRDYVYIEARYFLDGQEKTYTGQGNFIGPAEYYFALQSPIQDSETFEGTFVDLITNALPDLHTYDFKFVEEGEQERPLSGLTISGQILDGSGTPVVLKDLGTAETDSLGVTLFQWVNISGQVTIKVTIDSYTGTPSYSFALTSINSEQAKVVVPSETVQSFTENIVPGASSDAVFTLLTITPSTELNNFINDVNHPLTSLREIRKAGYLAALSGYETLSQTDKDNLDRLQAQAYLNLTYFPSDATESIDKYVAFNDLLYSDSTNPVSNSFDVTKAFSSGEFVSHGRSLRASLPSIDQPSDFALASMYTLAQRQVQVNGNFLAAAAADLKYNSGTGAGKKVFTDNGHSQDCECEECMTAVSPLSYLSSLINYAEFNVKNNSGGKASISDLSSFLRQPLGQLKVDCDEVSKRLCNFRVQVETLYKYSIQPDPQPMPFDLVEGAKAGYSFRKLGTNYSGYSVRVRRVSDDQELDIGFSNGMFDIDSYNSFVGNSSGFCVKIYDQSGNGKDLQQLTKSYQAEIKIDNKAKPYLLLNSGHRYDIITSNKSYWKFLHDGTGGNVFGLLQTGLNSDPGKYLTWLGTVAVSTGSGLFMRFSDLPPANNATSISILRSVSGTGCASLTTSNVWVPNKLFQLTTRFKNTGTSDALLFRETGNDKANAGAVNPPSTSDPVYDLTLFCRPDQPNPTLSAAEAMEGKFYELFFYENLSDADRDELEANQSGYLEGVFNDCSTRVFNLGKAGYLQSAYQFILRYIGTDFYELKSAQNDQALEENLAERLGVPYLYQTTDHPIVESFFDISVFEDNLSDPLGVNFTAGISALEDLLENIFGLRKDSTDPLLDLGDCKYLLWRRESTRRNWESIDNPENIWLTEKDYYIDPDVVNMDDIRYDVDVNAYPVKYPVDLNLDPVYPDSAKVLDNRKRWGSKVFGFFTDPSKLSEPGFVQGLDKINLSLASDSHAKIVPGSLLFLTGSDPTQSTFLLNRLIENTGTSKFEVELESPLEKQSISLLTKIKFEIGYPIDTYDASLPQFTIPVGNALAFAGNFIRFYNPANGLSRTIEATAISTTTFSYDSSLKSEIETDFPISSEVYFLIETGVDQTTPVTFGTSKVYIFHDVPADFSSDTVFEITGSGNNDGFYESDGSNTKNYTAGTYCDFNVNTVEITVRRTNLDDSTNKSAVVKSSGSGKVSFEKNALIEYFSNGDTLIVNANNIPLAAENVGRAGDDDQFLFQTGTGTNIFYDTVTIAQTTDIGGTNDSSIKLLNKIPSNFRNEVFQGNYQGKVLIETSFVDTDTLKVIGRDITGLTASNVEVLEVGNYGGTPIPVTTLSFSTDTLIEAAPNSFTSGTTYILAVKNVVVEDNTETSAYFKLKNPGVPNLPDYVSEGIRVEAYSSSGNLLGTYSAQDAQGVDIIYIEGSINISGQDNLSFFPEYHIVNQFTRYAHKDSTNNDIFQILDENPPTNAFEYSTVIGTTTATNPVVWTTVPTTSFHSNLESAASLLKSGQTSLLPVQLSLSTSAFLRFVELYSKHYNYLKNPSNNKNLDGIETVELNILLRLCVKNALLKTTAWKDEEAELLSDLQAKYPDIKRIQDPRVFQFSLYSPKITEFTEDLYFNASLPYLDGQFPLLAKVPNSRWGESASEIISKRETTFSWIKESFSDYIAQNGLDAFFTSLWAGVISSNPSGFFDSIYGNLYSTTASTVSATEKLISQLGLDKESFLALFSLRKEWTKKKQTDEAQEIKDQIVTLVSQGYKQSSNFPQWLEFEKNTFTDNSIYEFWGIKQDKLIPWLSSAELRSEWIKAILKRQEYVAVDPDFIDIKYFRDISSTDPTIRAFNLLNDRLNDLLDWITPIGSGGTLPAFPSGVTSETEKALYYIEYFLEVTDSYAQGLFDALDLGEDISNQLAQLGISPAQFYRLKALTESINPPAIDFEDVEEELLDILVVVRKFRSYPEWRDIEVIPPPGTDIPVLVGPELFKDPVDGYALAQNPNHNRRWRFNEAQLRIWNRLFRARTLQWNSLEDVVKEMLSEADDSALIILRNAYVELTAPEADNSGKKYSFEQKQEILSNRFLQDFAVSCCSPTTHVSTAIGTLQRYFQILNTESDSEKYPVLASYTLQAPYFEKEWKWLGSYGSFRSAMFVYIYPENLLHPALRKNRTSKFGEVVNQLNQGGVFTPDSACKIANEFGEYLTDISNLNPQCGANCLVLDKAGPCSDKSETGLKKMFFGFGKGGNYNRVYYTTHEVGFQDPECFDWKELKQFGNKVVRIIGASPSKKGDGKRYLYVFAEIKEKGKNSCVFLKYDLDELVWDEEYSEMEFPEGTEMGTVVLLQRNIEHLPVLIFLKTVKGVSSIWMNMINEWNDDWNWEQPLAIGPGREFHGYKPIDAIEVKSPGDTKIYPVGDIVVVYQERWDKLIVLQPFTMADPQYHFYQLNSSRLRPGKLYGVSGYNSTTNEFEIFKVNTGTGRYLTEGELVPGVQKTRSGFGVFEYKGIYCYGKDGNREFALLLKEGANPVRQLKLNVQASTQDLRISNIDELYKFLFTQFNIGIGNAWIQYDGFVSDFYEILSFFLGNSISYPSNSRLKKWYDDAHKEYGTATNTQNAFLTKKEILRSGLSKWIYSQFDEYEDNPTWRTISYYLWGFYQLGTTAPVAPTNSKSDRPGILNVIQKVTDKNIWDGKFYANIGTSQSSVLNQEFEIVYLDQFPTSNVTHVLRNSFLPQSYNMSLGWKNSMPVIFGYQSVFLTPITPIHFRTLLPTTGYNAPITANKNSQKFQQNRVNFKSFFLANQTQCHIMTPHTEAYYFLPVLFGLKLHEAGYFENALEWFRAVYDYKWGTLSERKIWYGLVAEEANYNNYSLSPDWLLDPLNPHQIALTRSGAYTSFTIQSIVKCLLDYGDQQFTIDTVESIPVATHLYEEVEDLMNLDQFKPSSESCACGTGTLEELWNKLRCLSNLGILLEHKQAIDELSYLLDQVESCTEKETLLDAATGYFTFASAPSTVDIYNAISNFQAAILTAIALNPAPVQLSTFLTNAGTAYSSQVQSLQSVSGFSIAAESIAIQSAEDISLTYQMVTGYDSASLLDTANTPLNFTTLDKDGPSGSYTQGLQVFTEERDVKFTGLNSAFSYINESYEALPLTTTWNETTYQYEWIPGYVAFAYCIPDNPVYESNRLRAELNLFKIRNCFNIAGMKRELDPYSAPIDATSGLPSIGAGGKLSIPGQLVIKPTQYRYAVLIQWAKELIQQAQQLEAVYLSSLEKKDAETYTMMKAKQDLKLSKANVKLNDLKVKVSEGEVDLAKLQMERSQIQVQELENMIQAGLNQFEQQLIGAYMEIMIASQDLATLQGQQSFASGLAGAIGYGLASASAAALIWSDSTNAPLALSNATQAVQSGIQASFAFPIASAQKSLARAQGNASIFSIMASLANRQREWKFQKVLAEQDIKIGQQQMGIAQDRLRVSGQELKMAEMQQTFAEDSVEFLRNKFTNADLYNWMSRVLASAYSTVLNEATALAKLAMYQLMFDRQQQPPVEIADNYWEAPSMDVSLEQSSGPDRRGITGSYRLQQDVTRMDGWAFTSDQRKLEVSKTVSLSRMFPLEFQEFRRSGRITFNTLMEHFDRDFPGQYMRIIRRVTTNVIALVPPTEGIKATLSSSGISEVVIKGDRFQNTLIRRTPERIAISNPTSGTGILELQPQGEQFNNPFEGNGVAMQWEFELPIESNFLDYSSISDVLITIQYTALDSIDYRNEVIRKLPREYEGERLYSLRSDFSDQFYELSHPEDSSSPFKISFDTLSFDFPGNLKEYYIRGLRIMLVANSQKLDNPDPGESKLIGIEFQPYQSNDIIAGNAILGANNFAGTIGPGGSGLQNFIGRGIDGTWTLDFSILNNSIGGNTPQNLNPLKKLFEDGEIADILFVVDFGANFKNS